MDKQWNIIGFISITVDQTDSIILVLFRLMSGLINLLFLNILFDIGNYYNNRIMIMLLIIVVLVLECRTRIENGPLLRPITNTGHQNIVYSDNNRPFLTSIHDLKNSDKEYSYNCGPDQQECLVSAEYNGNYIPDIVSRCRLSDKL